MFLCVCVCVLPAITSSILSSIIHVRRIITLTRSPFATSDITVNPLRHTHKRTHACTHNAKQTALCCLSHRCEPLTQTHICTHTDFGNTYADIKTETCEPIKIFSVSITHTDQINFSPGLSHPTIFLCNSIHQILDRSTLRLVQI